MTNVIINKEELLNEEQLDGVSGGSYSETMELIRAIGLLIYVRSGTHAEEAVTRQFAGNLKAEKSESI